MRVGYVYSATKLILYLSVVLCPDVPVMTALWWEYTVLKEWVQLVHESKEALLSDLTRLVVINYRFLSKITSLHSHLESLQHSRLYTNRLSVWFCALFMPFCWHQWDLSWLGDRVSDWFCFEGMVIGGDRRGSRCWRVVVDWVSCVLAWVLRFIFLVDLEWTGRCRWVWRRNRLFYVPFLTI
jgi:hypothetical protein